MLRSLLTYAKHDPRSTALADAARGEPQRAFVSASLRPYLLASLIDAEPERPALVVAGDDRAARDLAADLTAFLAPRPVRFYPARGVRYESHLAPPPHLVGLRIAALDALLGERGRGGGGERGRARREGARPRAAPARLRDREGRAARPRRGRRRSSWPAATSASTRWRTAASSPSAATSSTSTRPPRSARCAASCSTSRSSGSPGSRPSPSARSRRPSGSRSRRPPSSAPEHRELAEIAAASEEAERPDVADVLPVDRFRELLDLAARRRARRGRGRGGAGAGAARLLGGRDDELPRRGRAPPLREARRARRAARSERAALRLSSISQDQPHEFRAQAADTAARSLRDAEPELEKLVRSGYRTFVAWARRGEAERARLQPRPHAGRLPRRPARPARTPSLTFAAREPARRLPRARPEARGAARAPAAAPPARRAARRAGGGRRSPRSPSCAPARRWSTRTTASRASPASRRRPSAA